MMNFAATRLRDHARLLHRLGHVQLAHLSSDVSNNYEFVILKRGIVYQKRGIVY